MNRRGSYSGRVGAAPLLAVLVGLWALLGSVPDAAAKAGPVYREDLIPILGVQMGRMGNAAGAVAYLRLTFERSPSQNGLRVQFPDAPGQFSRFTQAAVRYAITNTAQALGLAPETWTVKLAVPYDGLTVYGASLSAMVAVAVAAQANGEEIRHDCVITGTVMRDGRIGAVSYVPLKIEGAAEAHLRRVIIPDERDPADDDWRTPFLMQVSPMDSVQQAYRAMTD